MSNEARWYIMHMGDSKKFNAIQTIFMGERIEHTLWVPTKNVLQKFRGRDTVKSRPLIPGYLFAKFLYIEGQVEDKLNLVGAYLLKRPGARHPEPVEEFFIEKLKTIEQADQDMQLIQNTYNLKVGDSVEVVNGPFLSSIGLIKDIRKDKIVVELDFMNRPVEASLHPNHCTKIAKNEEEKTSSG